MVPKRTYRRFAHKGANFRICCERFERVTREIVRLRAVLEEYIDRDPAFAASLAPLAVSDDAPAVAERMARAAERVGVGPMAAVAGTMAQLAAQAGLDAGAEEAIVENGGDIYLASPRPVVVALYAGASPLAGQLALDVQPHQMPLAVCSSSSKMGHSLSLGDCDLGTVVARDAALADAAATQAANLVRKPEDIDKALEQIAAIDGVDGVLLIQGDRIGLAGSLPRLIRHRDADLQGKVTRDRQSSWNAPARVEE